METGGKGGNTNHEISNKIEASGYDGEEGENCGIVNIHNSVIVKAYGGAGGSAIPGTATGAGTGGGGYPAAGIGRRRSWRRPEVTMLAAVEAIVVAVDSQHLKKLKMVIHVKYLQVMVQVVLILEVV